VQAATLPAISPDGTKMSFTPAKGESSRIARLRDDGSVTDVRAAPEGFYGGPCEWSPDNRWASGTMNSPDGPPKCAVLDTETDTVVIVRKPDGDPAGWTSNLAWIDATRILARSDRQVFVFDVVSGESRLVADVPDATGAFIAFHTDGWLYIKQNEELSNLWLVTLDGPGNE
jgi:hypothetical protein